MRVALTNELWERGYADALVDTSSIVDPVAHTARVQFRLVPNHLTRVGEIVISGTDEISPATVQNSLTFRARRPVPAQRGAREPAQPVRVEPVPPCHAQVPQSFDSVKTVNVLLREAQLHEARMSGGFNTVDYIQTEGRFTHYNLLGGARRLDATVTVGNLLAQSLNGDGIFHAQPADSTITGNAADFLSPTWQASMQFTQPAFLKRARNSLALRRVRAAALGARGGDRSRLRRQRHLHALDRPARAGESPTTCSR